jgi:hypothetical protein
MSLDRCIKDTAGELGLKESDVREIAEKLRAYKKRRVAEGRLDRLNEDMRKFAASEAEKTKIAAALKRRQAALNIVLRDEWDADVRGMIAGGMNRDEAILAKLVGSYEGIGKARDSVSKRRETLEGEWLYGLTREVREQLPHLEALMKDPRAAKPLLDDTVRAWRGLGQGPPTAAVAGSDAHKLAAILSKYAEASRLEANRAGAAIGQLHDWGGPQSHDAAKVLRAGMERWLATILSRLDLERSFGAGTTAAEARDHLEDVYLNIVTGRSLKTTARQKGERVSPANLARSLEKERVLHFKSADDWIAYNDAFGRGNVLTGMTDHLRRMARVVSSMQKLGPNPQVFLEAFLESQRAEVRKQAGGRVAKAPGRIERVTDKITGRVRSGEADAALEQQSLEADLDKAVGPIGKAFAEIMGDTLQPGSISGARLAANTRATFSMIHLGGAVVSSLNDTVNFADRMRFHGHGLLEGYGVALRGLFSGKTAKDARHLARLIGVGNDSMLGDIHNRYSAEDHVGGFISRAQTAFFKWTFLTGWTDRLTNAFVHMTSADMAHHAAVAWAELPEAYRHVLGLHGIDEARWGVLRQMVEQVGDYRYVLPEVARRLDDAAFEPLVADDLAEAEDAIRERLGAQGRGRAEAAVKRAETKVAKVQAALKEATDKLQAKQAAGKNTYHERRSADARRKRYAAAEDARRLKQERLDAMASGAQPVRDLTQAELGELAQRRERLIARARRALELDLRGYFLDEAGFGVVRGDDRTRMAMTQGTQPGTKLGEAIRFMGQYKGYPVAYYQKILKPSFKGRGPGQARDYGAIAHLIAATWVMGYVSMSIKDMLKGRTPKDPTRWETLMAALVQGGGAGIYGDFLFAKRDRLGGGLAADLIGPVPGTGVKLVEMWQDLKSGDAKAGDAYHFLLNNTPGLNIFWLRTGLNFLILNQIEEWISPGSLRRRERRINKDYGQRYIADPTPLS